MFRKALVIFALSLTGMWPYSAARASRMGMRLACGQLVSQVVAFKNSWNRQFYDNFNLFEFVNRVMAVGLNFNDDLKILEPYWAEFATRPSVEIMEVGAGYGRVSDYLSKRLAKAKIQVVEHSAYSLFLQAKYDQVQNVNVISQSILEYECTENSLDAVTLMFATLWEFPPKQKRQLLSKLHRCLKPEGILFVDAPDIQSIGEPGDTFDSAYHTARHQGYLLRVHVMTTSATIGLLKEMGFGDVECTPYNGRVSCVARK